MLKVCRLPAYGVHDGAKLLACSDELAEMFGAASAAEVLGQEVLTLIAPEAQERSIATIFRGAPRSCASVGVRLDGAAFPIQVTSSLVRSRECGEARLVLVRDLSPAALVVDDEPELARITAFLMRHAGYQTATYTSPRQALADYQAGVASVIVTDVSMPELDGVALAQRIRKLDPGVPVIFVSGYSTEPVPQIPGTIFVKKPFGIAELERALASLPERVRARLE